MRLRLLIAAAAAAVTASLIPGVGHAGYSPDAAPSCVVHVKTGATTCYSDLAAALRAATGGRASHPDQLDGANASLAAKTAAPAAGSRPVSPAFGSIVLEIAWKDANFLGESRVYSGHVGCDDVLNPPDWTIYDLQDWNDKITSFRTYADCVARHWEHPYWGGNLHQWSSGTANIGAAMNDKASSIEWS